MPLAGALARASDVTRTQSISKATTEGVGASTVMQNDDHLAVSLEAGKSYRVTLILTVSSGGSEAGDIKTTWTFSGTASKSARNFLGLPVSATDATDTNVRLAATALTSSVSYGIDAGAAATIIEEILLEELTVAGTLQLQWAQDTSNATQTVLSTSSRLFWEVVDVN